MRRIKGLLLSLCALVMLFSLTGCKEKMTAEKLVKEMVAAMAETPMTQLSMDVELAASLGAQGMTLDIAAGLSGDARMSTAPYAVHMDMEMNVSLLGEELSETMEIYLLEEAGEMAAYIHMDSADQWVRESAGMDVDELSAAAQNPNFDWLTAKTGDQLVLAEETVEVNGVETYMLTCVLTWDDAVAAMESMDDAALEEALGGADLDDLLAETGLDDLDLSVVSCPVVYYVDTKTHLPLKMEMDVLGLDVLAADVVNGVMGALSAGEAEVELTVDVCRIVMDNIGYGPADIPALPPEAADAISADDLVGTQEPDIWEEPDDTEEPDGWVTEVTDLGRGPFDFRYGDIALRATLPEGWFATEAYDDMMYFSSEDQASSGNFTIYTPTESTYEDLITGPEDSLYYWKETEEYDSHGDLGIPGSYTLWIRFVDGSVEYYGVIPVSEAGWLTFTLYDAYGALGPTGAAAFLAGVQPLT